VLLSVHRMVFPHVLFTINLVYLTGRSWFRIHDHNSGGDIYLAFNAHEYVVDAVIPPPPHHKSWSRVVWNLSDPAKCLYRVICRLYRVICCSKVIILCTEIFDLVVTWSGYLYCCFYLSLSISSSVWLAYNASLPFCRWIPTWNHQMILS
jgi:hypothetical protein